MGITGSYLVALGLLALTSQLSAQTTESKRTVTLEGARVVASAAAAAPRKGNEGASIAIVDDGGYLGRIQPTFPMGATISTEKARTAASFRSRPRFWRTR